MALGVASQARTVLPQPPETARLAALGRRTPRRARRAASGHRPISRMTLLPKPPSACWPLRAACALSDLRRDPRRLVPAPARSYGIPALRCRPPPTILSGSVFDSSNQSTRGDRDAHVKTTTSTPRLRGPPQRGALRSPPAKTMSVENTGRPARRRMRLGVLIRCMQVALVRDVNILSGSRSRRPFQNCFECARWCPPQSRLLQSLTALRLVYFVS